MSLTRKNSRRVATVVVMLAGALGWGGASPAAAVTVLPTSTTAATSATAAMSVWPTCSISGCAAAMSAHRIWADDGFPSRRGWYDWPNGKCNYAGGTYRNQEGELPSADRFREFDVKPRACGASRDAYRVVVDMTTGDAWYSPDHYTTFYEIV